MRRALGVVERIAAGLVTAGYVAAGAGLAFGWMSGPVAVGVGVGTTTVLYTALLVLRALAIHVAAGSYSPCRGVGFLGMGVLAGGASLVGAVAGPEADMANLVGVGVAAASVLFVLGLLLLPGTAPTLTSRLRRMLDGAAIGLSLFLTAWTFVLVPLISRRQLPVGPEVTVAVVVLMVLSAALAVTALIGARAIQHRTSARFCCSGVAVSLVTQATAALLLLVGAGWPAVLAVVAMWATGPVLIWAGARRSGVRLSPLRRRVTASVLRMTTTTPLLAVSAGMALVGAIYHLVVFGPWGIYTAMIAVSTAGAVGVRGMFASLDVCRYTARLVTRENQFLSTDPLTAMPNRMRLRHRLEVVRGRAEVGDRFGTLLVVDLDNFGELDDLMGHDVGDALLMEVARRLRTAVDSDDLVVRLAGDSFAVLTVASRDRAAELAERLRGELAEPYPLQTASLGVVHPTASIGVAECNAAATVDEMIRAAELAVGRAQELGGDRIEWYDESLELRTLRRRTFAHELVGAVRRNELDLRYTPVVSLPDGIAVGLRAGAQWRHATLGEVSQTELLVAADDTGLVSEIGDWTLRGAVRQFGRWLADRRDLTLSVRISAAQLRTPGFATRVANLLRTYDVPPDRLVLEVAEQEMPSAGSSVAPLAALRDAGVRTGLAGFGVGRCPLLELRKLPIDRLTVDASLVAELRESEPVVATVVDLAHRLGLEVVADGVSELWHAELLNARNCRYATGTLFSRPVPAEYAEAYLDAGGAGSATPRP